MNFVKSLLTFKGRISRSEYWIKFGLFFYAVSIIVVLFEFVVGTGGIILTIWTLIFIWPQYAAITKRLHDRNKSAWYLLIFLIPIANIWIMVQVAFLRGTDGPNRFGDDPLLI